ncbi:MAG: class I SAM-dependent methyltransferase [Candidatus Hodarchaeota archaeon]
MLKTPKEKDEKEISIREQVKNIAIKSLIGFHTIIIIGIGGKLDIFDYLYEKTQISSESDPITSVTFTLNDLIKGTKLNAKFLDAWLHMALECGLFELDNTCDKCFKTGPYIYQILIDRKNMVYMGDLLTMFFNPTLRMKILLERFKTGEESDILDFDGELVQAAQINCRYIGASTERIFSKYCKEHKRILRKGGSLLEVGVGYGNNLEHWAKKYKKARIVGIDIDQGGVDYTQKCVEQNNWSDRIEIICIPINKYADNNKSKFDVIMLNQVLHEMNPDHEYRKSVFVDLYTMLKDDGLLIVNESMMPDIYSYERGYLFEIMHKWLEVAAWSKFYNEKSFKELIDSTPFTNSKLIREGRDYLWVIQK